MFILGIFGWAWNFLEAACQRFFLGIVLFGKLIDIKRNGDFDQDKVSREFFKRQKNMVFFFLEFGCIVQLNLFKFKDSVK